MCIFEFQYYLETKEGLVQEDMSLDPSFLVSKVSGSLVLSQAEFLPSVFLLWSETPYVQHSEVALFPLVIYLCQWKETHKYSY